MSLTEKDIQFIWHPYTHQKNMLPPIPIVSGKGALLFDETGNTYIDAISSWWVNLHGHAHPYIAKKIYEQAKTLEQVIFAGFTHKPAVELAEKLIPLLPGNFAKIFYSDNGSTSVEVAIKMALQFWSNNGESKRKKILAFNNSYHGDTFGAMSTSSRSIFTNAFSDKLFDVIFIDIPTNENIDHLKSNIKKYKNEIAGFIYEPLLQGAGGMKMYNSDLLNNLLIYIKEQHIICIADEVLTGFYRTGKMFAGEYMQQKADIICLSKGLTGGTMALGVTACTHTIYNAFVSDDKIKTFYHGHSFTANPLACTAAIASLYLLQKKECKINIDNIISAHNTFINKLPESQAANKIKNLRQSGTILAFEINTKNKDGYLNIISDSFTKFCLEKGVYLRPLGNTVYVMPPYCISKYQLNKVYKVIEKFLNQN
ncbi:MAG: adenosylmethionine--8-amino-7-oxononanoate transaminase [Chitinophagaceae bacterium]|nr:adenosylmethionine--8-amino-7-oxononanoate transaminase [Chitinophagaceae bacterium]